MNEFLSITKTTLKMLFRNKQSLFFTWFLPLFLMVVIGYITKPGDTTIQLGVVYNHENAAAVTVVEAMGQVDALKISSGTLDTELQAMKDNKRDLVLRIPDDFTLAPSGQTATGTPTEMTVYENAANPSQSAVGSMIVQQFFQRFTLQAVNAPELFAFKTEQVTAEGLRYVDFLVPGIIAMTIMQLGIFGTAFAIVDAKQKGVLKRVMATPVRPWQYVTGNMVARLILSFTQAAILVAVARFAFDVQFHHWGWLVFLVLIGNVTFLSLGLFISGVAKTVETVPVLGNLVVFPMMLLGGIFFPTTGLPGWLKVVVDQLPIAVLADLMRKTVTFGKTLGEVYPQLLILIAWAVLASILANVFFKLQEKD